MAKKQKELFTGSEVAKGSPLGKQLQEAGRELGRFRGYWRSFGGLLTRPQAATLLGVSQERVRQLGNHDQVRTCECFGQPYYSARDLDKRLSSRLDDMAADRGGDPVELRAVFRSAIKDGTSEAL